MVERRQVVLVRTTSRQVRPKLDVVEAAVRTTERLAGPTALAAAGRLAQDVLVASLAITAVTAGQAPVEVTAADTVTRRLP